MWESILEGIKPLIGALSGQYGVLVQIIGIMGTARAIMKVVFTAAHAVAEQTSSSKDDEFIGKVESSKVYKVISFALDYAFSIKLPQKE